MRRSRFVPWLLMILLLAGFGVFLAWPIWLVVATGFEGSDGGFTLYHVLDVFRDPVTLRGLFNALGIAVCTNSLSARAASLSPLRAMASALLSRSNKRASV